MHYLLHEAISKLQAHCISHNALWAQPVQCSICDHRSSPQCIMHAESCFMVILVQHISYRLQLARYCHSKAIAVFIRVARVGMS